MTLRLLVVDDSEVIRTSLRALLGSVAGIAAIREAKTLSEALAIVRADPPALVILDMNMPDGLGMDIIKPLKQLSPAVLIAVFTIEANPVHREVCLALGADWFFEKATGTDALLEVVCQLAVLKPFFNSSREQSAGVLQVSKAVMQMDRVTQQNATRVAAMSAATHGFVGGNEWRKF